MASMFNLPGFLCTVTKTQCHGQGQGMSYLHFSYAGSSPHRLVSSREKSEFSVYVFVSIRRPRQLYYLGVRQLNVLISKGYSICSIFQQIRPMPCHVILLTAPIVSWSEKALQKPWFCWCRTVTDMGVGRKMSVLILFALTFHFKELVLTGVLQVKHFIWAFWLNQNLNQNELFVEFSCVGTGISIYYLMMKY